MIEMNLWDGSITLESDFRFVEMEAV
jgi:hypothetical protein